MSELYLGLMSGTSVDGVDAAIAQFGDRQCRIVAACTFSYPPALRERIEALIETGHSQLSELGSVDVACGRFFGDCGLALIRQANLLPADIAAIGHHGQTIFHRPHEPEPFTLQIGDPNSVAAITGIETVADLRGLDMALGGQGAPLVPAFHQWLFASAERPRLVANVGGIANVTALIPGEPVIGFDTGPGNTLVDLWTRRHLGLPFDDNGNWAAQGTVVPELLDSMLADEYFSAPPPKSTGRERFNANWLDGHLNALNSPAASDAVQATLVELTAETVSAAATSLQQSESDLIVCGGGTHNGYLLERLAARHAGLVKITTGLGLDPDWVEAAAFAWLARARLRNEPGNVPTVTGARQAAVLGGLYSRQDT